MKNILRPGGKITLVCVALTILGLVYSLGDPHERNAMDYSVYLFSSYTLAIVCMQFPLWMKRLRLRLAGRVQGIQPNSAWALALQHIATDYELRSLCMLYLSLGGNLLFALYKLILGVVYRSFWMGALGSYYAVLAFMRFSLLRPLRNGGDEDTDWRAYRRTAWQLNFLALTMSGVFVQMVLSGQSFQYPGHLIYAMALWAFVKIISAIIGLVKRRKDEARLLAAARCISFAAALMSILALQTALIHQFGEGDVDFARLMNSIGGGVVIALLITLSAMMISRSSAWMQTQRQENSH